MGKKKINSNLSSQNTLVARPRLPEAGSAEQPWVARLAPRLQFALNQFIAWYCSEPRLAFNRIVVTRYRMYLESLTGSQDDQPATGSRPPSRT